jgi:hypothetical protein
MNLRRWTLLAPAGILSMTLLALLGLLVSALDAGSRGSERENIMLQTKTSATRPPMDAAVPAKLETATFALG